MPNKITISDTMVTTIKSAGQYAGQVGRNQ